MYLLLLNFPATVYTMSNPLNMKNVSTVIGAAVIHIAFLDTAHCNNNQLPLQANNNK